MKKLQVLTDKGWKFVFCEKNDQVVTTDDKNKALPPKAMWGESDLAYFRNRFANQEFRLAESLSAKHEMQVQMSLTGYRKDYGEVGQASWVNEDAFIGYLRLMGADLLAIRHYREHGWVEFVSHETCRIGGITHKLSTTKYHYFKPHLLASHLDEAA